MPSFTELALKVAAAKAGDDLLSGDAAAAWAKLSRLISQLAWSVHSARSQLLLQGGIDFAEHGAIDHVFSKLPQFRTWLAKIGPQDPQRPIDPFLPWCRTVLDHKYTDLVRQQSRELGRRKQVDLARHQAPGEVEPWQRLDELSSGELARLERLDPLDGVILFTLTGQWTTLPAQLWQDWLARCGLDVSFPPDSVRNARKHQERPAVAAALGISRNALDQRISRLRRAVGDDTD